MDTDTKLDYRIAMEVMGWHLDDAGFWRDVAGKPKMSSGDVENYPDLRYTDWPTWSPTTKWPDFGLVLERVWDTRRNIRLEIIGFAAGTLWALYGQGTHRGEAEGTEPLEAACRAILEAFSRGR